jgi:hypothetical protein
MCLALMPDLWHARPASVKSQAKSSTLDAVPASAGQASVDRQTGRHCCLVTLRSNF